MYEEKDNGYRISVATGDNQGRYESTSAQSTVWGGPRSVVLLRTGQKNPNAEISGEDSRGIRIGIKT